ncbi:imelysin family protein [Psychromonas ossibalaenae]|uniref:imelysin family protein n=1 Tax=Psychromonas ossibalaenae TaxID=444922 RepID=UPI000379B50E|nr:imelysin family protein [Psychromonas ossibalaenae]
MLTKKIFSAALLSLSAAAAFASFADHSVHKLPAAEAVSENQIKNNYIGMAQAAYDDSLSSAQTLHKSVQELLANPTNKTLAAAKEAYKNARIPYQQSEIMRWDTDITLTAGLDKDGGPASVDQWEGQVNAWPLDEQAIDYVQGNKNAGIINQKNAAPISIDYLIAQNGVGGEANVTTGFHAVEFLLWGQDLNGTKAGAGVRDVNDFQTDSSGKCSAANCDRRRDYLQAAVQLLITDLTVMSNEWSPVSSTTKGTLAYNFYHSSDAVRQIIFAMKNMATDELASARMNEGLEGLDPEQEHDCFSDLSHVAVYYNFQGIRNAFYGGYEKTDGQIISGASIADYINQQSPALYNDFDKAFNSIEKNMKIVFNAGEKNKNPIRFDQIIGQKENALERTAAVSAVYQLVSLQSSFDDLQELLSLQALTLDGSGD